MNPGSSFVVFLLALIALEAWSKPALEETSLNINTKAGLNDLLDKLDDKVPVEADEVANEDDAADVPSSSKNNVTSGIRVCLRLRLLRLLFRMFMLKASGFNIQQLLKDGSSNSTDTTTTETLGLTSNEMMDICSDLCALGTCPPGCPGNNLPPWGQGRR